MPPPVFVAVAVKVMGMPRQIVVLGLAAKLTEGVEPVVVTDIVIPVETAVVATKHGLPPLIEILHVTTSPLASVVLVKVFAVLFWRLVLPFLKL
jgi:hypothetical protein